MVMGWRAVAASFPNEIYCPPSSHSITNPPTRTLPLAQSDGATIPTRMVNRSITPPEPQANNFPARSPSTAHHPPVTTHHLPPSQHHTCIQSHTPSGFSIPGFNFSHGARKPGIRKRGRWVSGRGPRLDWDCGGRVKPRLLAGTPVRVPREPSVRVRGTGDGQKGSEFLCFLRARVWSCCQLAAGHRKAG